MNDDRRSPGPANVFATSELWRRQARQPDYRAENAALRTLAPRLVDPVTDFSVLSDLVIKLCRANGAAVSLLERNQSGDWIFRWTHVAGELAPPTGGSGPRDFSPCGVAIERGGPQLFRHPELFFPHFQEVRPAIVEGLVIPMRWNDEPLGTIWVVSHDEHRTFDGEDARMMESLAAMTAAAIYAARLNNVPASARRRAPAELQARKDAERIRNEWVRQLIAVQEEERRRIARELHDQLGAHLTTLTLGLEALHLDPASADHLRQTLSHLDHDISRIVRDLRPGALLDLGLAAAVRAYVEEWSHHSAVPCDFHSNGGQSMPVLVETTIYRIVQEALTNVARHARATRASVVIAQHDSYLTAIVEDDGVGFEPGDRAAAIDGRLGLIGMRERAALLGGTCTIESRAGAGTNVVVKIPLGIEQRL